MKTTWIINTNMGKDSDILEYVKSVKESGANVIEVEYIPFSGELPKEIKDLSVNGPLVVYGATTFIKFMREQEKFAKGVFGDETTFTYENWNNYYGDMLLNSKENVELTTIENFLSTERKSEDYIFVRPQHDTKSIVGEVLTVKSFRNWCAKVVGGGYAEITKDTEILVGEPYGISAEWRLFIVDNKVAASSQYKKNGRLYKEKGAPKEVFEFAEKVRKKWNPTIAYTLDICKSANNYYIVEI